MKNEEKIIKEYEEKFGWLRTVEVEGDLYELIKKFILAALWEKERQIKEDIIEDLDIELETCNRDDEYGLELAKKIIKQK